MTVYRGFNVWAYLLGAVTLLGVFSAAAVIAGPGKLPMWFDLFALLLTYAIVLTCTAGIFEAIRHIRFEDGDMDWGEGAPAKTEPATSPSSPLRTVKTPA